MFCKFCGGKLEDGSSVCPSCGKDNKSGSTLKIILAATAGALVVAILAVVVFIGAGGSFGGGETTNPSATGDTTVDVATFPTDGNPDDETCKGTYTAEDDVILANKVTAIATVGDSNLTNGQLQIYYWMQVYNFLNEYGSYAAYLGLDYTKPLDVQLYDEETWQQLFLSQALNIWYQDSVLYLEAEKAGYEMDADLQAYFDTLEEEMRKSAEEGEYDSLDAMLQESFGPSATFAEYEYYQLRYYKGYTYYADWLAKLELTDAEIEAYYTENAETLNSNYDIESAKATLAAVRHVLIQPEGGTATSSGTVTYTDEEWEACRVKAQGLLDQWLAGEHTEETFHQLAVDNSKDGNAAEGGLYPDVYAGQMVPEFNDWCFDESRVYGDYGLVKSPYGYHIMFFVDTHEGWYPPILDDLRSEKGSEWIDSLVEEYPLDVAYEDIYLADISLVSG